jgi:hypothetical protein
MINHNEEEAFDASDEAEVKRAEDAERDRVADWAYILKEPRGRRWIYNLIHYTCHVSAQSLNLTDQSTVLTAFNEGGRAIGLTLLEEIRATYPDAHKMMMEENHYG